VATTRSADLADSAELEQAREDAAAQRLRVRELEEETERLQRRLAARPNPETPKAIERAERAEARLAELERRGRRMELARRTGLPLDLLEPIASDDGAEAFAERASAWLSDEHARLAEARRVEAERQRPVLNGRDMPPISESPDELMNQWIRDRWRQ
jgi:hypothetical protein